MAAAGGRAGGGGGRQGPPPPLPEHLARRERGHGWDSLTICRGCARAEASCLEEHLPGYGRPGACHHVDKAFCAAWLDSRTVLIGTKCSTLLSVDADSGAWQRVPLIPPSSSLSSSSSSVVGATPSAPPPTFGHPPPLAHRALGIHAVALVPASSDEPVVIATAGAGPGRGADVALLQLLSGGDRDDDNDNERSSARPSSFRPLAPLVGHADAVFGVTWLSPRTLLSASRDGTVKAWRLEEEEEGEGDGLACGTTAAATSDAHGGGGRGGGELPRVRDVRATGDPGRAVSVGSDGYLAVWDARSGAGGLRLAQPLLPVQRVREAADWSSAVAAAVAGLVVAWPRAAEQPSPPEITNLAASGDLVAVASRSGATLVDLRCGQCAHVTPSPPSSSPLLSPPHHRASPDPRWVRSVSLRSRGGGLAADLLSVGTADGRLMLYDLRMASSSGGGNGNNSRNGGNCSGGGGGAASLFPLMATKALSDGHLDRQDPSYRERFHPMSFPAAAQAHAWEPAAARSAAAGARVFVGGGPLPSGVRGCYLGVWG